MNSPSSAAFALSGGTKCSGVDRRVMQPVTMKRGSTMFVTRKRFDMVVDGLREEIKLNRDRY